MAMTVKITEIKGQQAALLKKLGGLKTKVGRDSLRAGMRRASRYTVRQLKAAYPPGKSGLFRKSLAGKAQFNLKAHYAIAVIGQRNDKAKRKKNENRGVISKGIPGRSNAATPIHLVDNPSKEHIIRVKRAAGGRLWWNEGKGRVALPSWRRAMSVNHPGIKKGKRIVPKVEAATRVARERIVRNEFLRYLRQTV